MNPNGFPRSSLLSTYKEVHRADSWVGLGWVDFDLGFFTLCLVLPGLPGMAEQLGKMVEHHRSKSTPLIEQMDHPVVLVCNCQAFCAGTACLQFAMPFHTEKT